MTDIAALGIAIDSRSADQAAASLDNMVAAGGRAEAATAALGAEARVAMAGLTGISGAIADFDTRAARLKASVDPLGAAMDRVNAEMREADALYKVGAIGAAEYANGMAVLETRLEAAVGAQNALTAAQMRGAKMAGLTAAESLNLSRQMADVGVSLAMGMNPLMVLIQQGPQVADIMGTAAARGVGWSAALTVLGKQLGLVTTATTASAAANLAQATTAHAAAVAEAELAAANVAAAGGAEAAAVAATQAAAANVAMGEAAAAAAAAETVALAPLALIIGVVVAGLALLAGGFAIATHELNEGAESADQLQKRLGLTDEQMKKVKNTSITMGDTISGTATVAGKYLWEAFGPTLTKIGTFFHDTFEAAVANVMGFARSTVVTMAAAYSGVTGVWAMLPSAMGDLSITAANAVIAAIEGMVNGAIGLINELGKQANLVAFATGSAIRIPTLSPVEIGRLTNNYQGAARAATQAYAVEAEKGARAAGAKFDEVVAELANASSAARDARVRKQGGDPKKAGKGREEGLTDAEREYERILKSATDAAEATEIEVKARQELNYLISQGLITSAEAARALELEKTIRPIIVEAMKVEGAERKALLDLVERITKAQRDLNGANLEAQMAAATEGRQQQLVVLQAELELIGKSNRERTVALAVLREEQALKAKGYDAAKASDSEREAYAKAIASVKDVANAQADLREGQAAYNAELHATLDILDQIDAHARDAASNMASAFDDVSKSLGNVVRAFGGVMTAMTGLAAREEAIRVQREKDIKEAGGRAVDLARIEMMSARESAKVRVESYGDMAAAGKGFFEEGTEGYKVMQAAEIAFRAIEMVMSVQAMAQKGAETTAHVAAEGVKATASGITAYAVTLASLPFPYNLAAGAVVLAALAGIGVALTGGGASAGVNDAQNRQDKQGTGSVLGDAKAKSESIARSLEIVASNTNADLEFSNEMVKSLRSIDSQIGVVAAALARSFGAGGMLDTSNLNLGSSTQGPGLLTRLFAPISNLLPGLFGSTTTRKLQDQGVQFGAATLDDIMSGGLSGKAYQQIMETTKKKAFGLTYSESNKVKTKTSPLDDDFLRQTELLIGSLRDGVVTAASVLGIEGAEATLAAFTVNLGKLSFKDMKADEIQAALEAVFGKVADDMAGAVLPGLADFQKVGEGLFETLTRVARQYQVVDVTLASIGKTFGLVGVSSLAAREHLVGLFADLDEFTERTTFYAENFLTEAERLAPIQAAVTAEMARLGLASVDTRDEFKAVVQGLDLSTAAGAELYAALMMVAPAFAKVTEESKAVSDARDTLSNAYERESSALEATADRFRDFATGLRRFREGLYAGPSAALSPEAQYQASKAEFDRVAALASAGNENALGDLQSVSEAYLNASKAYYASSAGYFADLTAVRDAVTAAEAMATAQVDVAQLQLDALTTQVSTLIDIDEHIVGVAEAIAVLNALLGGGTPGQLPSTPVAGSGAAANDNNAAILAQLQQSNETLQELVDTQRASLEQQAAISAEQQRRLEALEAQLARQLRETQAG